MPIKTKTVTSMVLRTWSKTSEAAYSPPPQKPMAKRSYLKAKAAIRMKRTMGTILATVTTVLMKAASLMPRRTMKWTAQRMTEETATEVSVLPTPKAGRSLPTGSGR